VKKLSSKTIKEENDSKQQATSKFLSDFKSMCLQTTLAMQAQAHTIKYS